MKGGWTALPGAFPRWPCPRRHRRSAAPLTDCWEPRGGPLCAPQSLPRPPLPPGHFFAALLEVRAEVESRAPASAWGARPRPPPHAERRRRYSRPGPAAWPRCQRMGRKGRIPVTAPRGRGGRERSASPAPGAQRTRALPRGGAVAAAGTGLTPRVPGEPRPRPSLRPMSGRRGGAVPLLARPGVVRGAARGGRAMGPAAARGGGAGGGRGLPCARPAGARALSRG